METRTMTFKEIDKEMQARGIDIGLLRDYEDNAIGCSTVFIGRLAEMWPGINDLDFKGLRVLDVGCGSPVNADYPSGMFHPTLARAFAKLGADVTGVDLRPGNAKDLYNHIQMNLATNSMRETLKDESFDLVTCTEFFTDPRISSSMWRNGKSEQKGFWEISQDVYDLLKPEGRYMLHSAMGENPLQTLSNIGFDAHQKSRIFNMGDDDRIFFCRKPEGRN